MSAMNRPPVPELADAWVKQRRRHLEDELARGNPGRLQAPTRRLTAAALTVVVLATVAVLLRGVFGAQPTAFAGWTPAPTPARVGQIARVESACPHTARLILADTRGPFSLLLFVSARTVTLCIGGPSIPRNASAVPATNQRQVSSVAASSITVATAGAVLVENPRTKATYRVIDGQVGARVKAVTLVLSDGLHVQTTTANGWFAAWWPGTQGVARAIVQTSKGTQTHELRIPTIRPGT
jgi:hypothetical protein